MQPTEGATAVDSLVTSLGLGRRSDSPAARHRTGVDAPALGPQANAAGWHQKWHELPENPSKIVPLQVAGEPLAQPQSLAVLRGAQTSQDNADSVAPTAHQAAQQRRIRRLLWHWMHWMGCASALSSRTEGLAGGSGLHTARSMPNSSPEAS